MTIISNLLSNVSEEIACALPDGIFLPKGTCLDLPNTADFLAKATSRTSGTHSIRKRISFTGSFILKIALSPSESSPHWIFEKHFASPYIQDDLLDFVLDKKHTNALKITLYAKDDSALFYDAPDRLLSKTSPPQDALLYNFIFPRLDLCTEEALYYRLSPQNACYSFQDARFYMEAGGMIDLTTYFNAFSACKWAQYTNVKDLIISLDFQGDADVFIVQQCAYSQKKVTEFHITAAQRKTFFYTLPTLPDEGILGVCIVAKSSSIFFGGAYFSDAPSTQDIHLGIGITSFKREANVIAAVKRLSEDIEKHPVYAQCISITVVDNGQTLQQEDIPNATLIPSHNYGGTGGFMRNLLHFKDLKTATHCLFMDDDASCETDSIFRSMSFLKHVTDASTSIAGAMLCEEKPFLQWESGAYFDTRCHPLHCNYDLRSPLALVHNEKEEEKIEKETPQHIYGAWWFFLFPLKQLKTWAFPFFVRGDDIEFSYSNDFHIIRMNGIGSWQQNFKSKENATTLYLDTRSHVAHHLNLNDKLKQGPWQTLTMFWSFASVYNWSYQYDTANAIIKGFSDALQGPEVWLDDMDTSKIRSLFQKTYHLEVPKPLRENYKDVPKRKEGPSPIHEKCMQCLRKLSKNGHFLPSFMMHKKLIRINKQDTPNLNDTFLHQQILVYDKVNNTEVLLQRNTPYFLKNYFLILIKSVMFCVRYKRIQKKYTDFFSTLKNDTFWRKQFNLHK